MACLMRRVAAVASAALVMAPPTTTMEAPASTARAAVSELMPPATATGMETAWATCAQRVPGGLALHLLVDGDVDAHVAGAHRLGLPWPGRPTSATWIMSTMISAP